MSQAGNNKNKVVAVVVGALVVAGGSFFGGVKFGQSTRVAAGSGAGRFANLTPDERQARFQQFGGSGSGGGQRGARSGDGFVAGEVIAKDGQSITVKLRDARLPDGQGGSKIIFYTEKTAVTKMASGSLEEIAIGTAVVAMGTANQDGSISAATIQLRPEVAPGGIEPPPAE